MKNQFTLEYRIDNGWYVGKLLKVPGVFSQGETLKELEENVQDAYKMMVAEEPPNAASKIQNQIYYRGYFMKRANFNRID